MVNSISSGPTIPDLVSKAAAAPAPAAPAQSTLPALGASAKPLVEAKVKTDTPNQPIKAPPASSEVASSAGPLVPNLTSLALYKDSESGLQVAVVRDRISGQVVEQFPTERARRLVVLVKQQEAVAQELQSSGADIPHVDIKT